MSSELHHEDSGTFNEFYVNIIKYYSNGLNEYLGDDGEEWVTVFNAMTTSVREGDDELLNIDEIWTKLDENFIKERETSTEI